MLLRLWGVLALGELLLRLLHEPRVALALAAAAACPSCSRSARVCVREREVAVWMCGSAGKPRWKRAETASAPAMSRSHAATASCESDSGSVSSISRSLWDVGEVRGGGYEGGPGTD